MTTGMRRILCAWFVMLVGAFALPISAAGAISPATASPAATVSPPASVPSNCSSDVSQRLQNWLQKLPAGTTVGVPPGACYLINEGLQLVGLQGLTVSGGTWEDETTPPPGTSPKVNNAEFWLVGGSDITLENMTITGANPGGYYEPGAFMAGIRSDGVLGLNIENVLIAHTYGDGIELNALRGAQDDSGTILDTTNTVTISNVHIDGPGRQGITLDSVDHALISSVRLDHVGQNVFDVEADQGNEGAANVTIDGCTAGQGNHGLFFANGGAGGAYWTRNITVENCTMEAIQNGDAVLVQTPPEILDTPRSVYLHERHAALRSQRVRRLRAGERRRCLGQRVDGRVPSLHHPRGRVQRLSIERSELRRRRRDRLRKSRDGEREQLGLHFGRLVGTVRRLQFACSEQAFDASGTELWTGDRPETIGTCPGGESHGRSGPGTRGEGSDSARSSNTVLAADHGESQAVSAGLALPDAREAAVVLIALCALASRARPLHATQASWRSRGSDRHRHARRIPADAISPLGSIRSRWAPVRVCRGISARLRR